MTNTNATETVKDKIKHLPLSDATIFEIISLLKNPESNFEQIVEKLSPDIVARSR